MTKKKSATHRIAEDEFMERVNNEEDVVFIDYDRATGILTDSVSKTVLDRDDEEIIGRDLIDSFIAGKSDTMHARNERLDLSYEFTRWDSSEK